MRFEDLQVTPGGDGTIKIRRLNTDQMVEKFLRYLAPDFLFRSRPESGYEPVVINIGANWDVDRPSGGERSA